MTPSDSPPRTTGPSKDGPPEPPRSLDRLKWKPQPMVPWFDPLQLVDTAVRAVLSSIFGAYADKREVQAALTTAGGAPLVHDYSQEGEFWIDYTADLGDGFDATYTVAWLLGQERLPPAEGGGGAAEEANAALADTRRGRVLILGGDQVYPTATREEYENRFTGPYEAALPWAPADARPRMFAVPGNHDWYDGLTSFIRLMCQQRWIGGWQTRQARSYFALKLPNRWWLLGIDVQLEADIDKPQLEYFKAVAQQMQEGDHVILCTAEPTWVHTPLDPKANDNLAFFERVVLCPVGARLMLTLSGDLHHYARYSDSSGERHKVTAGGGGAYLYGTHLLPEKLELPKVDETHAGRGEGPDSATYGQGAIYPDAVASRSLRRGAWRLPFRNPRFALLMGVVYALYAWLLDGAGRLNEAVGSAGFSAWVRDSTPSMGEVYYQYLHTVARSPLMLVFSALFVLALWVFCRPDPGHSPRRRWIGVAHGLAHLAIAVAALGTIARYNLAGPWTDGSLPLLELVLSTGVSTLWMIGVGSVLGGLLMGLSLLPGVNFNEAYSCQYIEHYKNFVRMNIASDGTLHVYPIGVDEVAQWEIDGEAKPGAPYFRTRSGKPPRVRLIETPFRAPAPSSPPETAQRVEVEAEFGAPATAGVAEGEAAG